MFRKLAAAVTALCALLAVTPATASDTFDRIMSENRIVVGAAPWNGFVAKNPTTGEFEGLIVDDIRKMTSRR